MRYTLYKGDTYIAEGTLEEIEEQTGRNRRHLQSVLSKTKRLGLMHKKHNHLMLVPKDAADIERNIDYYLHKIVGAVEQASELDEFNGYNHSQELEKIKDIANRLLESRVPKRLHNILPKEHWGKVYAWYEGDTHVMSGTVYEIAKQMNKDIQYVASREDSKRGDSLVFICDQ